MNPEEFRKKYKDLSISSNQEKIWSIYYPDQNIKTEKWTFYDSSKDVFCPILFDDTYSFRKGSSFSLALKNKTIFIIRSDFKIASLNIYKESLSCDFVFSSADKFLTIKNYDAIKIFLINNEKNSFRVISLFENMV